MKSAAEVSEASSLVSRRMQVGLVLLPVAAAYGLLWRLVTATPIIDDYWHIFAFALGYEKTTGAAAKLHYLLTTQVGPYKLVFEHALVVLQLAVLGHMNFPSLILLGNLTLLGLLGLFWKGFCWARPEAARWPILLLPMSLLLFSMNYAETVDWAISGLQQPGVILFSVAALYFLTHPAETRRHFLYACGFTVLACATYANGMILWPLGVAILWERGLRARRMAAWCAAGAVTLAWFLYHYQSDGLVGSSMVGKKIVFFVMFCGGGLENMHHRPVPYVSLAIGLAVLAGFAHSVRTKFSERSPFLFSMAVWVLLTGAVVASARTAMGLELSLSSRYKIYCDLLLIYSYGYGLDRIFARSKPAKSVLTQRAVAGCIAAALLFYVGSNLAGAKFLTTRRQRADDAMRRYLVDPEKASPMFLVEEQLSPEEVRQEDMARQELNEAIRMGIYTPPRP